MPPRPSNGTNWIMASVLVVLLAAVGGFIASGNIKTDDELRDHQQIEGHPVMANKVNDHERRIGSLEVSHQAQMKVLQRIDANTRKVGG